MGVASWSEASPPLNDTATGEETGKEYFVQGPAAGTRRIRYPSPAGSPAELAAPEKRWTTDATDSTARIPETLLPACQ